MWEVKQYWYEEATNLTHITILMQDPFNHITAYLVGNRTGLADDVVIKLALEQFRKEYVDVFSET
ncbi:hypothetical protein WJ437_08925 [Ignavigranum ruoffiae]|uniref:hypothetical protein n=1 Tax=Ignavigranum ruoffiae TaxID=89093 RepID=UPI003AFF9233